MACSRQPQAVVSGGQGDLATTVRRVHRWLYNVAGQLLPPRNSSDSTDKPINDLPAAELILQTCQQSRDTVEMLLETLSESYGAKPFATETNKILSDMFVKAIPEIIKIGVKAMAKEVLDNDYALELSEKFDKSFCTSAAVSYYRERNHWHLWTCLNKEGRKERLGWFELKCLEDEYGVYVTVCRKANQNAKFPDSRRRNRDSREIEEMMIYALAMDNMYSRVIFVAYFMLYHIFRSSMKSSPVRDYHRRVD
jgi:hypothetical protein